MTSSTQHIPHPAFSHDAQEVISRKRAYLLLALTCGLFWFTARHYLGSGASYGDDNSSHLAWMITIAKILRSGGSDFFFDQQNLGVPMFLSYHPLPGLVSGSLYACLSPWISAISLFKGTIVLLWSCMPLSWYVGGRWLGFSRASAFILGLFSWGLHDTYGYGLTLESVLHHGFYAQLYGMFFLPLALGSLFRYIVRGQGPLRVPVLYFWLLFLSHSFLGIYVGQASLLMIFFLPKDRLIRCFRATRIYFAVFLLASFWILPLLFHLSYVGGLPWKKPMQDGLLWSSSLSMLFRGQFFDAGRWPWMSLLAFLGVCAAWHKRKSDPLLPWLLWMLPLTGFFFLGSNNLGGWYKKIPLHGELNVMRYMMGIHVCALFLAAWFASSLYFWLKGKLERLWEGQYLFSLGWIVALLVGAYLQTQTQYAQKLLRTFPSDDPDFQSVVRYLKKNAKGRYVAARRLDTNSHFHRDLLAALSQHPQLQSYGMTFHATLGTYFAEYFLFQKNHYRLFNVQTLVSRKKLSNQTFALSDWKRTHQAGAYNIYQRQTKSGFFGFVRAPWSFCGHPKKLRTFLKESTPIFFGKGYLPTLHISRPFPCPIASSKRALATSRVVATIQKNQAFKVWSPYENKISFSTTESLLAEISRLPPQKPRSRVLSESIKQGGYSAKVYVEDPKDLLFLKINYFPYWHATSDNKPLKLFPIAPNFMAVKLKKGTHHIHFYYKNPPYQKVLLLCALLFLLSWFLISRFFCNRSFRLARSPMGAHHEF